MKNALDSESILTIHARITQIIKHQSEIMIASDTRIWLKNRSRRQRSPNMSENMSKLCRVAVGIGGFLIMMGIFLMIAIALAVATFIDAKTLTNETYLLLFMLGLLSMGILDIIIGIMFSRG